MDCVQLKYTLTGRQAGSLYNVKLELASAFPDTSRPASMASTWQVACLAYDFVRFLYRPQEAVDKAVTDALASVSQAASDSLASAVAPALKVIKGAAGSAREAEKSLRDSVGWVGWKWAGICGAASAGLLVVVWSLAVFMTPSGSEMAELRANATDLERRGGKIKLSTCEKRLCARIDAKASGVVYGENGEKWMILDGY